VIVSVDAIEAPHLNKLIEYFGDHVEYLVIALLEEDAKAINKEYNRIHDI